MARSFGAAHAMAALAAAALLALALPARPAAAAQRGQGAGGRGGFQPRDTTSTATPVLGTAILAGSVILDGAGTPVRHARVTLSGSTLRGGRATTTDESGQFTFEALPAGRFTLTASKPGLLDMSWGAKRPGRPGTPIELDDGQKLDKFVITLPHGSVLTGTVVDENGDPAPGTEVIAMQYVMRTGEKSLQQSGRAQTDDRGVYRIFQLQPGDYVVRAEPRNLNLSDLRQSISTEIASLMQQVQASGGGAGGGGPGAAAANLTGVLNAAGGGAAQQLVDRVSQLQQQLSDVEQQQTVAYAPVYFPGTTSQASATTITLGVGEERAGVDFRLELVPTAKIEGSIVSADGTLPPGTQVALLPADRGSAGGPMIGLNMARVGADGRFTFSNVTPGQYTIEARATIRKVDPNAAQTPQQNGRGAFAGRFGGPGGPFGPGTIAQVLWASADVAMAGQDIPNVVLNLQPGMTLSGNVTFQGGSSPPSDLTRVRITLSSRGQQPFQMGAIPPADVDANGHFTITGIPPGEYGLSASVLGGTSASATSGAIGGFGQGAFGGGRGRGGRGGGGGGFAGGAVVQTSGQSGQWVAKSAIVGGRDAFDFPIDIAPNQDVSGVTIVFSDQTQQLSGTMQDSSGRPSTDYTIIVFPSDPSYWVPQARRIVSGRPDTDGHFSFSTLPAGDYRLAAVTDVETGEWYDPAFLSQILPASISVSIADGEKKTQDIKLGGGS